MTAIRPAALRVIDDDPIAVRAFDRDTALVLLPAETHAQLEKLAERTKLSVSEVIELALARIGRPRKRADCVGGQRPCPWLGCRHNLIMELAHDGVIFNSGRGSTWRGAKPRGITSRTGPKRAAAVVDLALQWWNDEVEEYELAMAEYDQLRAKAEIDGTEAELPPEPRMAYSCTLDVVDDVHAGRWQLDDGKMLLEDIGDIMHVTRERVRQIETSGLAQLDDIKLAIHADLGIDGEEIFQSAWALAEDT